MVKSVLLCYIILISATFAAYPKNFTKTGVNTHKRPWPIVFGGYQGDTDVNTLEVTMTGIIIGGQTYDKSLHDLSSGNNGVPYIAKYSSYLVNNMDWAKFINRPGFSLHALQCNNYMATAPSIPIVYYCLVLYGDPADSTTFKTIIFEMATGNFVSAFSRPMPSPHEPTNTDQKYQLRYASAFGQSNSVIITDKQAQNKLVIYNALSMTSGLISIHPSNLLAMQVDMSGNFIDVAISNFAGAVVSRFYGLTQGTNFISLYSRKMSFTNCNSLLLDSVQYSELDYLIVVRNCNSSPDRYLLFAIFSTTILSGIPQTNVSPNLEHFVPLKMDGSSFSGFEVTSIVTFYLQQWVYFLIRNKLNLAERYLMRFSLSSTDSPRVSYYSLQNYGNYIQEFRPLPFSINSLLMMSSNTFNEGKSYSMLSTYRQAIIYLEERNQFVLESQNCYDFSGKQAPTWIACTKSALIGADIPANPSSQWTILSTIFQTFSPISDQLKDVKIENLIDVCSWCFPLVQLKLINPAPQALYFKQNMVLQILYYEGIDISQLNCPSSIIYTALTYEGQEVPKFLEFIPTLPMIIVSNTQFEGMLRIKVQSSLLNNEGSSVFIDLNLMSVTNQVRQQKTLEVNQVRAFSMNRTFYFGQISSQINLESLQGVQNILPVIPIDAQRFVKLEKIPSLAYSLKISPYLAIGNYSVKFFERFQSGTVKYLGIVELIIKKTQMDMNREQRNNTDDTSESQTELRNVTAKIRQINCQGIIKVKFSQNTSVELIEKIRAENFMAQVSTRGSEILKIQLIGRTSNVITFKVDVIQYDYLSLSSTVDTLDLTVIKELKLKDQILRQGLILSANIPPQVSQDTIDTVSPLQQTAQILALVTISSSFVLNLLMSSSMSFIWGDLSVLQSITILQLMSIQIPGQARQILDIAIQLASLDVLPSQQIFDATLAFDEDSDSPVNEFFDQGGYSSKMSILNLQSTYLYLLTSIFLILIFTLTPRQRFRGRLLHHYSRLHNSFCMNYFIRFTLQSYQQLALASLINLMDMRASQSGEVLSSLCTIICIVVTVLSPIGGTLLIHGHSKTGNLPQRLSSLTEGLKLTNQSRFVPFWSILYLLKRLLTVLIILTLRDSSYLQLQLLTLSSLIYQILLITYKPYETAGNNVEIFNELTVSCCLYSYMLLTDFVESPNARVAAGWGLTATILLNIGVNMGITFWETVRQMISRKESIRRRVKGILERVRGMRRGKDQVIIIQTREIQLPIGRLKYRECWSNHQVQQQPSIASTEFSAIL
ncbi:hypothetical protein FGO68_gene5952 [Halteria grandinella]|uniref:TRP C-terminal domain-containing protein n=1 Tax=Halteria grandinella TaxID=5974 RepID=A0A8J8T920_HALGN|nr:hypothetical protein FGO68_gene5952 [Halteria grandinella]